MSSDACGSLSAALLLVRHTDACGSALSCASLAHETRCNSTPPHHAAVAAAQDHWGALKRLYKPVLAQHPSLRLPLLQWARLVPTGPQPVLDVLLTRCRQPPLLPLLRSLPGLVGGSSSAAVPRLRIFVYERCAGDAATATSRLPAMDARDALFDVRRYQLGESIVAKGDSTLDGKTLRALAAHRKAVAASEFVPARTTVVLHARTVQKMSAPIMRADWSAALPAASRSRGSPPPKSAFDEVIQELTHQWRHADPPEEWTLANGVSSLGVRRLAEVLEATRMETVIPPVVDVLGRDNATVGWLVDVGRLQGETPLAHGRVAAWSRGGDGGPGDSAGRGLPAASGDVAPGDATWPASASSPGFCGVTLEGREGNCESETGVGMWQTRRHRIHSFADCAVRCMLCNKCRYITYNPSEYDCSWYARCNMRKLGEAPGFASVQIRTDASDGPPRLLGPQLATLTASHVAEIREDRRWHTDLMRGAVLQLLWASSEKLSKGGRGGDAAATLPTTAARASMRALYLPFECVEPDFMLHNRRLLPTAADLAACATTETTRGTSPSRAVTRLKRTLQQLVRAAEDARCARGTTIHKELAVSGSTSMLSQVLKPWTAAIRLGRALDTPTTVGLMDPKRCARNPVDLGCFFEPIGPACERRRGAADLRFNIAQLQRESPANQDGGPIPVEYRPLGSFWWTAQLMTRLVQPNEWMRSHLDATARAMGLAAALDSGPVIGMHVRHGDSCLEVEVARTCRECEPLARYMEAIEPYAASIGASTIFLATDSHDILERARADYPKYRFLALPNISRSRASAPPTMVIDEVLRRRGAKGVAETHDELLASLVDMLLLARCKAFVGKFTSGLFRWAYALAAADAGGLPPFISLDAPWCSDYEIGAVYNDNFPTRGEGRGGGGHGNPRERSIFAGSAAAVQRNVEMNVCHC